MTKEQQAKLAELEEKHGPCAHVVPKKTGNLLVFRTPSLDEWEDFQEALQKKRRGVAFREFAQICCVEPEDIEKLKVEFEATPAIPARIADALSDLAGAEQEVTVKKD